MSNSNETMEVEYLYETEEERVAIMALRFVFDYLSGDAEDLANLSAVNKELMQKARASDWLWQGHLPTFPCHDVIKYPDVKENCLCGCWIERLSIPVRLHGPTRDGCHYEIHPRDRVARRYKPSLVLNARPERAQSGTNRLNPKKGVLEDLFHLAEEPVDAQHRTNVWLPREFPCDCVACCVTLYSQEELFRHCVTFTHLNNSRKIPIPHEFVDPRHDEDFDKLSAFEQGKEFHVYEEKMATLIMEPVWDPPTRSAAFQRYMTLLRLSIMDYANHVFNVEDEEDEFHRDMAMKQVAYERVIEVCVTDIVLVDFFEYGLNSPHVFDVIVHGYDEFGLYGENTFRKVFNTVVNG